MDQLQIVIEGGRTVFRPGESVRGRCEWVLDGSRSPSDALELHLLWFTRGKGDEDIEIVQSQRFASSGRSGHAEFDFALPETPYSFSGKLISLTWALELVVGDSARRSEIVVAPGKEPVALGPAR